MMSSSGFQRVNGLRLWVHRFREPSAPPSGLTIVLVHGFMDAGSTWDLVAPILARGGHDVIAPDLRGFGLSDWVGPGGYYHFPDYVADLAELIDSAAPRRLALVGHSMGGTVAALYAGAHRERIERLALLEGMGPIATEAHMAVDRMQAWLRTMREVSRTPKPLTSLQEAIERLALHHPRVSREIIETRARLLTRADETGRLIWAYDPLHRTTAPTPFHAEGFKEFLRRIDCPTLVVSGGPAGWHPPDEDERVACLAHAQRFELPQAGHMMHWTAPAALGERLAAFFSEPLPASRRTHPQSHVDVAGAQSAARPRIPSHSQVGTELPLSAQGATPSSSPAATTTRSHAPDMAPPASAPTAHRPLPPTYSSLPMAPPAVVPAPPAGQVPVTPTRPAAGVTRPDDPQKR